ncbi:MAG: aminotransferase class I/II-fold pyridoxal phosphate-dependent enzyme [Candidatus Schekmanbacteria bacterium]|nr:aminotransferase class I/II-fold pyridoxal phosphate-dependent enzyme [Candidatus Schekmanbacteria bacterium]
MLSHRIPRLVPNTLAGLRAGLGERVIDLTVSNPTKVGLALPAAEIRAALDDPRLAAYEPEPFGRRDAREAVCAYYAGVHGVAVEPRDVALTASTSEAYSFLLKLLTDPGDRVLIPTPSYPLFTHLLQLDGACASSYGLVYDLDRWCIDLDAVEHGASGGARAIIAVGPNNPTGSYLKAAEVGALDRLAGAHGIRHVRGSGGARAGARGPGARRGHLPVGGHAGAGGVAGVAVAARRGRCRDPAAPDRKSGELARRARGVRSVPHPRCRGGLVRHSPRPRGHGCG